MSQTFTLLAFEYPILCVTDNDIHKHTWGYSQNTQNLAIKLQTTKRFPILIWLCGLISTPWVIKNIINIKMITSVFLHITSQKQIITKKSISKATYTKN